jgi:acetyl-CoA C-acetyltransferase
MSRGPYWMPSGRRGARMGEAELIDPVMGALTDPFNDILMGVTAENLAERGSVSRERQDAFAVRSHQRAAAARAEGRFDGQIVPVPAKVKRESVDFARDEHIREDASAETMAKLKPVFKPDGTVTAGNASGMNDAGAAITAKILDEMESRDLELGLVTLCIGGGQGIALLLGRE